MENLTVILNLSTNVTKRDYVALITGGNSYGRFSTTDSHEARYR